jgi:hypothetical protein
MRSINRNNARLGSPYRRFGVFNVAACADTKSSDEYRGGALTG